MTRRLPLRFVILGIVAGLVIITLGGALALLSYTARLRDELESDTQSLIEETEIAEQIVVHVDRQLLEAQRYLRDGSPATLASFRHEGDQVYTEIRRYLLHDLSAEGRLQVEEIKELHEMFEVAAQSTFDRAHVMGEVPDATALSDQVVKMENAVDAFRAARRSARDHLREAHQERLRGIYVAVLVVAAVLVGVLLLLARVLQRRLLAPIADLANAAGRLGQGALSTRVHVSGGDEMGAVSLAFNDMADRIQTATEEAAAQHEELMETFDHLQRTQQELIQHEKLSAMGEMLAGLAHELNNPLAGVLGLSECLMQELDDGTFDPADVREEIARPLVTEALRARDLVRNLLSFSRMSGGALQPVELAGAVRIAAGIRGFAFSQAQLRLEIVVPPGLWVLAEPQQLQHAFVNILNNARDALASAGGTRVRIDAVAVDAEWVEIRFTDDGPGFRDPDRVFDPFYTTKPVGAGTGLGLTLVHRFVRQFGGSASVENARPRGDRKGAVVRLRLRRAEPIQAEDADAASSAPAAAGQSLAGVESGAHAGAAREARDDGAGAHASGSAPAESATPSGGATASMRRQKDAIGAPAGDPSTGATQGHRAGTPAEAAPRERPVVLVVDDEAALRSVQRRMLAALDVDVVLAANGSDALAILRERDVAAVVTDIRMPGAVGGVQLYEIIRREWPHLAERVLFVTGDVHDTMLGEFLDAHPERVVRKPFGKGEYLDRVREVLRDILSSADGDAGVTALSA
ncbi:MAG TPA: ATP-binding protein [Gemmatimonadaceae bacterium]|nr:ATP-binding protein [Gemmatimonadaceae bacterium]